MKGGLPGPRTARVGGGSLFHLFQHFSVSGYNHLMARTALELSPDEWALYDPAGMLQHRQAAEQELLARRRRQALQVARRAARLPGHSTRENP